MLAPETALKAVAGGDDRSEIRVTKRRVPTLAVAFSVGWLAIVVGSAIAADALPLLDPAAVDPFVRLQPPLAPGHFLGTDELGRDILARMVYGARVSLIVGIASVALGASVGVPLGMLAGYFRRRVDAGLMFVIDVLLAFPSLVLILAITAFIGQGIYPVVGVLGFLAIPAYTRISRAITLATSSKEFVLASRAQGARDVRILVHEIFPNLVPALMAFALINMGVLIVAEGSLSFLGLSVHVPTPSWGGLIAVGQFYLEDRPTMVLIPSFTLFATVLALNFLGDAVRKAYDVREGRI
jgi:peptide/nickel transport system permease protein